MKQFIAVALCAIVVFAQTAEDVPAEGEGVIPEEDVVVTPDYS